MTALDSMGIAVLIGIAMLGVIGAWLGTGLIRSLAWRFGWIAEPRADRWHSKPTALHGGIGFYPIFFAGTVLILYYYLRDTAGALGPIGEMSKTLRLALALLGGSLLMFFLGLLDDTYRFRPATKLLFQIIGASIFIYAGGVFQLTGIYVLNLLITYFWFLGIINSINMLDNMDGLAPGVAILAGATLVYMGIYATGSADQWLMSVPLGLLLVGSLLGFWLYNRPPASIFMGDSGSLFIGYVLASLAIPSDLNGQMGIQTSGSLMGPLMVLLIPATVMAIPIFDTTLVTITRYWRAKNAFDGGQDHSSHRLVGLGLSEQRSVMLMYGLAAYGGITAIIMQRFPDLSIALFGFYALVLIFTGIYLGRVKLQTAEQDSLPPAWTPLVSNLLHKRHAIEVLLDTTVIAIAFIMAYLLRFEGTLSAPAQAAVVRSLPLVVICCLLTFALTGIYRGQWGLISISDLPRFVLSTVGGTFLSLAVVTLATRFGPGHSRSAYLIFGLLLFLALVATRLSFRLFDSIAYRLRSRASDVPQCKVLIYGAGSGGKMLFEYLTGNPDRGDYFTIDTLADHAIVGFVDDDPHKAGRLLCGLPIKTKRQWLDQVWPQSPEIWVSSRHISDETASKFASHWNGDALVRRLQVQLNPVSMNGLKTPLRRTTA